MSDNLKRTTSHAKTVDLNDQKTALDLVQALKDQFDRANTAQEPAREQDNTRQTEKTAGPDHAPVPEPHLRPEGEIRRAVDRQIDEEKREKLDQRAKELKELKELSDAWKHERDQKQRDHDRDRDRSYDR